MKMNAKKLYIPPNMIPRKDISIRQYKRGAIYSVSHNINNKRLTRNFKGELIQETSCFITLRNNRRLTESFLKVDFLIGNSRIKEGV